MVKRHSRVIRLRRDIQMGPFPRLSICHSYYRALCTLPDRMHLVHTFIVLGLPLTMALTLLMFGTHFRLVLRFEWLTLLPNTTPFLHISQTLATNNTSFTSKPRVKQKYCIIKK